MMNVGDVYYIDFPYDDNPEQSKKRPAVVILAVVPEQDSISVLKITTQEHHGKYNVPILDLKSAGLNRNSYVQCNRLETVSKERIVSLRYNPSGYYGTLCKQDLENVQNKFAEYYADISLTAQAINNSVDNKMLYSYNQNRGR